MIERDTLMLCDSLELGCHWHLASANICVDGSDCTGRSRAIHLPSRFGESSVSRVDGDASVSGNARVTWRPAGYCSDPCNSGLFVVRLKIDRPWPAVRHGVTYTAA